MTRTSLSIALSALAIVSMLIFASYSSLHNDFSPAAGTLTSEQQREQTPLYTVRVYQNRLAICRGKSANPWKLTSINVTSLRNYDQQLMQNGFPLYSEHELTVFLEDYGS